MLNKMREKHSKRILWALVIIIVPAFVLWIGQGSLKSSKVNKIGTIDDKKITFDMYRHHMQLAHIFLLLNMVESDKTTAQDLESLAMNFLLLLTEAKNQAISASDTEVVDFIKNHPFMSSFFSDGIFDQQSYENFLKRLSSNYRLGLTVRDFEEYIRDIIKIEKIFEKNVDIKVKEQDLKELYLKDTQTAKIEYIYLPYDKFKVDIGITPKELEDFYSNNKAIFKREPKVKLEYCIVGDDEETREELLKLIPSVKNIKELKEKINLDVKTTKFLGLNDPIENIGWQPQINSIAFALEPNKIGPLIQTEKGLVIIEKIESQESFTPALSEIENEVRSALILDKAKKDAELFANDILSQLNAQPNVTFKDFAFEKKLEYKETGEFKFYDYIEGLGLDENLSKIIFSLNNGQLSDEAVLLASGAYIIKLKEKTEFDPEDYKAKKPSYEYMIRVSLEQRARLEFIDKLRKKYDLKLYSYINQ
ncbi:MAG: peptidylprolyl isomerase [Candidatus Omnitrophica bacterium]|nr:peptidylprolyl isomerase [Candidatus Omnitrophota bacterium]